MNLPHGVKPMHVVSCRLLREEREALEREALARTMTVSGVLRTFVRDAIQRRAQAPKASPEPTASLDGN